MLATASHAGAQDVQSRRASRRETSDPLKTNGKVALAQRMFADQGHSILEICAALGISRATWYRYIKEEKSTQ